MAGRFVFGMVLIVAILFGQELCGIATACWRLDLELRDSSRPENVVVVLNVMPDRFHNERVSEYGVFAGHDGALNRIRLRMVSPDNLARQHSVDRPHRADEVARRKKNGSVRQADRHGRAPEAGLRRPQL
jgi:hypothetical protein